MAPLSTTLQININSLPDLEILKGKESELNWEQRDRLITGLTVYFTEQRSILDYSLTGMSTFSGSFADLRASFQGIPANDSRFIISGWIKNYFEDIMLILHTPRTQLSIRTCHFIASFALFLGAGLFDSFADTSLHHLLKLCGTTKKIIGNSAAEVAKNICGFIVPQRAFPVLLSGAVDKNVGSRLKAFECLKIISERNYEDNHNFNLSISSVNSFNCNSMHQKIWDSAVEKILQKGIGDANAEIRSVALSIFLIFKDKTPESATKFMDKLDPSTKKQLNLLLAKTSSTPKQPKPIVSAVPIALIRKTIIKRGDEELPLELEYNELITESPIRARSVSPMGSPMLVPNNNNFTIKSQSQSQSQYRSSNTSPTKSKLSPSKSSYEIGINNQPPQSPTKSKITPSKSSYDFSQIKSQTTSSLNINSSISKLSPGPISGTPTKQIQNETYNHVALDIPMAPMGSPMKIDKTESEFFKPSKHEDIFITKAKGSFKAEKEDDFSDEDIVLNVPREHVKLINRSNSNFEFNENDPMTNEINKSDDIKMSDLACELPETKAKFDSNYDFRTNTKSTATINNNSFMLSPKRIIQHSVSSPSLPPRIKSLGLASGTPLRAMYRNASESSLWNSNNLNNLPGFNSNSLLNDLIEEYFNTNDEACLKKISALTKIRSNDFDKLTSGQVHKLFINKMSNCYETKNNSCSHQHIHQGEMKIKILMNFLSNEPSLLAKSCKEIIELVEESASKEVDISCVHAHINNLISTLCNTNLLLTLTQNCIQVCCERISEFKLILLARCLKSFVVDSVDFENGENYCVLSRSIAPLLLALNHPNLNIRRLSINCFIELRNKLHGKTENVMKLLEENDAGVIPKRIIEGFLRQF